MTAFQKNTLTGLGLGALVLVLDQLSKAWILATFAANPRPIEVIPSCFHLIYAENRSAAFGILSFLPYAVRTVILTGFAVAVGIGLVVALWRGRIQRRWTVVATGLILGGALGNGLDRVRHGFVVDFIDWHIAEKFHWNVFNVADSGVVVGVALLLIFPEKKDDKKGGKAGEPALARS